MLMTMAKISSGQKLVKNTCSFLKALLALPKQKVVKKKHLLIYYCFRLFR